jgi:hypothetical protein
VAPTKRKVNELSLYNIRFSVNLPKARASEVLKVEYFFNHPTFQPKTKTSFDAASGFAINYLGWGCIHEVKVTLITRNESRTELPAFDMCAAPAWKDRSAQQE